MNVAINREGKKRIACKVKKSFSAPKAVLLEISRTSGKAAKTRDKSGNDQKKKKASPRLPWPRETRSPRPDTGNGRKRPKEKEQIFNYLKKHIPKYKHK